MADHNIPASLTRGLGRAIVAARWLMAPIYIGLLVGLVLLVVKSVQLLITFVPELLEQSGRDTVIDVLNLVDLSLVANLVVIVVLAGWQSFIDPVLGSHLDRQPPWLAADFSTIKLKLIGAIAVIAAIAILESIVHADTVAPAVLGLQLGTLLSIGVLGVLLALMDWLSHDDTKE
jgi:uncharacterized protein (TIGR00645 family)